MEQITLFFAVQVQEEKLVFMFSKYLKEIINRVLTGGKTLRERIKKYLL